MFEISDLERGLIVELWNKGIIWDTLLGTVWIPLKTIQHSTEEGPGMWWTLYSEVVMNGNEICGVQKPTLHEILLDVYYELPAEIPEDEAHFLIARLKSLNKDQEPEQAVGEEETSYQCGNLQEVSVPIFIPLDNVNKAQDSDCKADSSETSLQDAFHSHQTEHYDELAKISLSNPLDESKSRTLDSKYAAVNSRSDVESCSTCSQQPSLDSKPSLELTDNGSVDSKPSSSVTFSQETTPISYSEGSESDVAQDPTVESDCESHCTSCSIHHLSPVLHSDQDQSTCCSHSSSSCSCSSQDRTKVEKEADLTYSKTIPVQENMSEDVIFASNIVRAKWTCAIQKVRLQLQEVGWFHGLLF
nr:PREDICTED: protein unc-13 homolog B-like [Latimeria chalumnae]|eukprot:XP_014343954.1 PREDICTED: protein unc-13 homolog B-like [Latimeria chalumnae]